MFNRISIALISMAFTVISCISHKEHVDVLIVGGGASGIASGIQSARMGVETMILEETPWLGGMLTSAGVSCVDGNYKLQSGIFGEFLGRLSDHYGGWEAMKTGWVSNVNFEPQTGQGILTEMAAECDAFLDVRRECMVTDVRRDGRGWEVTVKSESGTRYRVSCDVLIDATELGDIAKSCGVEYRIGMESSSDTGESVAPEQSNDIIQDLTYVAVLKDYGPDADMTIERPEGYDPMMFANSCSNSLTGVPETGQTIWDPWMMITYGRTPNGRYMINWPIYGNDYYINTIEMSREQRNEAYAEAKNFTLCFIYFIQTHLGMKHLGLADDVFPTEDKLPFFPYHRESRRIVGKAFMTMDMIARPYDYNYYRTGIAVGDYPIDHHHFRHPEWKTLPDLEFYPVPSYNVPMGVMLPADVDDLVVAEKSVSVSNLVNGTTRLQPVVMQLGQAAGALAAISCLNEIPVKDVGVRQVQEVLLDAGCYLMPYLDLPANDVHFKALQRVGATGILRGEGRNVGWENQTWFRAEDPLLAEEIYPCDYYSGQIGIEKGEVSVGRLLEIINYLGGNVGMDYENWWTSLGLDDYNPARTATRLEAAVVLDSAIDPFNMYGVDFSGKIIR